MITFDDLLQRQLLLLTQGHRMKIAVDVAAADVAVVRDTTRGITVSRAVAIHDLTIRSWVKM